MDFQRNSTPFLSLCCIVTVSPADKLEHCRRNQHNDENFSSSTSHFDSNQFCHPFKLHRYIQMAPSQKPPSYKPLKQRKRPMTGLQAAFRLQEEQDLIEMEQAQPVDLPGNFPEPTRIGDQAIHVYDDLVVDDSEQIINEEVVGGNEQGRGTDEDAWVDIVNMELSEEQQRIVIELNSNLYQRKRLEDEERWTRAAQAMFDPYIIARKSTSHWGDCSLWNHDFKPQCRCPVATREVTLVDLFSKHMTWTFWFWQDLYRYKNDVTARRKQVIDFCNCQPDNVRLVQMGYFPASPTFPRTAFSIRLLWFYQVLWKYCSVRLQGFSLALDEFLDGKNGLMISTRSLRVRTFKVFLDPLVITNNLSDLILAPSVEKATDRCCEGTQASAMFDTKEREGYTSIIKTGPAGQQLSALLWTSCG